MIRLPISEELESTKSASFPVKLRMMESSGVQVHVANLSFQTSARHQANMIPARRCRLKGRLSLDTRPTGLQLRMNRHQSPDTKSIPVQKTVSIRRFRFYATLEHIPNSVFRIPSLRAWIIDTLSNCESPSNGTRSPPRYGSTHEDSRPDKPLYSYPHPFDRCCRFWDERTCSTFAGHGSQCLWM